MYSPLYLYNCDCDFTKKHVKKTTLYGLEEKVMIPFRLKSSIFLIFMDFWPAKNSIFHN